ncbi:Integrin alpha-6 VLA-6 [Takifugu flavidus]|uniref:Integrin alpha-6 VLA-6 n=1 Tax=Takifugu flavidus TaxID=433684 RepID=A0A5C6MH46_9TELE|nr:Integrin alpha-6 VLA-6 [Takifugu flavidus]
MSTWKFTVMHWFTVCLCNFDLLVICTLPMCAHRYQQWVPDAFVAHLLTGQCYLLGDDLQAQVQTQDKTILRMEAIDDFPFPIDDPRETRDIDHFNPELIPLLRNSYLGFSIDSGLALIRKGELTIVSGAPRGGYSGQSQETLVCGVGPGLASSFGYDVAVADFNVMTRVLYQRPGSLRVLRRILAVPRTALFWTEISGVVPGICWSHLLRLGVTAP